MYRVVFDKDPQDLSQHRGEEGGTEMGWREILGQEGLQGCSAALLCLTTAPTLHRATC